MSETLGYNPNKDNLKEMGDIADTAFQDEKEIDATDDSGMTRRDFIKGVVGLGLAAASGHLAIEGIKETAEASKERSQSKINEIEKNTVEIVAQPGDTIISYYKKSGYRVPDDSEQRDAYIQAFYKANNITGQDFLIAGRSYKMPIKQGE